MNAVGSSRSIASGESVAVMQPSCVRYQNHTKRDICPTTGLTLVSLFIKLINRPDNCYCCLKLIRKRAACTGSRERELLCSHKYHRDMYSGSMHAFHMGGVRR